MKKMMNGSVHPMVVFWLGVLTGAVVVALVFGYKMLDSVDYQGRVIRYTPTVAAPVAPDYVPPTTRGTTQALEVPAVQALDSSDVMWGTGGGGFVPTDDSVSWGTGGGGF